QLLRGAARGLERDRRDPDLEEAGRDSASRPLVSMVPPDRLDAVDQHGPSRLLRHLPEEGLRVRGAGERGPELRAFLLDVRPRLPRGEGAQGRRGFCLGRSASQTTSKPLDVPTRTRPTRICPSPTRRATIRYSGWSRRPVGSRTY